MKRRSGHSDAQSAMLGHQDDKAKHQPPKRLVDVKSGAERRQRQLMTLRHKTHGEKLKQLRGEGDNSEAFELSEDNRPNLENASQNVWDYNADSKPDMIPVTLLPQLVKLTMEGTEAREVFQGTLLIRKLLSVERDPPYDAVTASGVVPRLVSFLERDDFPELQFEAAWALTNIAAGTSENTVLLINCGAVPLFVRLLSSPSSNCRDQSAWAIGNLAGEGAGCRNVALENGAMQGLLNLLVDPSQPLNVLRNATWAASNLCRCKPQPPLESVVGALPVFAQLLHHQDSQLVIDAAWGISYISDGPEERVQAVLEVGVLPTIVALLSAPSNNLVTPAIRVVGNIAAGSDAQTQAAINAGALSAIPRLLQNPKRAIRKEACWTVSNIAAGSVEQIQALINASVYISVLGCLQAPELDVRKEAVWSVSNVTMCGTTEQVKYLVSIGTIIPLCDTLQVYDPKIVRVSLEALQCFLQVGEDERQAGTAAENVVARQVQECGGVDHLESLQRHANQRVYSLALSILESYFFVEELGVGSAGSGMLEDGTQLTFDENQGGFGAGSLSDGGGASGQPFHF